MIDPRTSVIEERLRGVGRILAVSSGKGGVGKSLVATMLALTLSRKGFRVGLFDLDFTSPSTHIILGAGDAKPKEEKGLLPPIVCGLEYMTLIYYTGNEAAPLRGSDTSNALIELLAVTLWGKLDFLVIDMPPGIGDAVLDLVRLVPRIEFLVVTTPSQLAFETVKKFVTLLSELRVKVLGVVENMRMDGSDSIRIKTCGMGVPFLGEIQYYPKVENAIGDEAKLFDTVIAKKVTEVAETVILKNV
jgi:ATP-binding protein involved in chromosome partitioning